MPTTGWKFELGSLLLFNLYKRWVFEFLGIKEDKLVLENDLEKNLVNHLSLFLMELGKGFMYVGNQVRITLANNIHYYVDLVFYNKILSRIF